MNDIVSYVIILRGILDESEIRPASPVEISVKPAGCESEKPADGSSLTGVTELRVCADQAGLVGLLRYLHGKGFVLLAVQRGDK